MEEGCQIEMENISFAVNDKYKFPLTPMGVLAPPLRLLDGVPCSRIDRSGILTAQVSAYSCHLHNFVN